MKLLGYLAYLGELFLDRVSEHAQDFHDRREARQETSRLKELRSMDADEVRKGGDIGCLLLARHIELAKGVRS